MKSHFNFLFQARHLPAGIFSHKKKRSMAKSAILYQSFEALLNQRGTGKKGGKTKKPAPVWMSKITIPQLYN
jgi:hypothetical protein